MKTSNKLLLGLFVLVLLSALAANIPLKRTFDTIDQNDPYYGYKRDTLPAFKYVKLTGNSFTLMQVQPGARFEMRSMPFERNPAMGSIRREVRGDTLFVLLENKAEPETGYWGQNPLLRKPAVYIMAPALAGVSTQGLFTKITGWRGGVLSVSQMGKTVLLTGNQFDTLSLSAYRDSSIEIDANNRVGEGTLLVRDSSRMNITKNVFKTYRMQVDSTAHVNLPGSMLR